MFLVKVHARFLQLRVDRKACGRVWSQLKSQVDSSEINEHFIHPLPLSAIKPCAFCHNISVE